MLKLHTDTYIQIHTTEKGEENSEDKHQSGLLNLETCEHFYPLEQPVFIFFSFPLHVSHLY